MLQAILKGKNCGLFDNIQDGIPWKKAYSSYEEFLESNGMPIGGNDLWIAAHAKVENLTLVTNNEKEFTGVPKLKVRNWVSEK